MMDEDVVYIASPDGSVELEEPISLFCGHDGAAFIRVII